MRARTLESVRFHARTMHAKEFRISPPQAKIADGEIDRNIYLDTNEDEILSDNFGNKLTTNA